MIIELKDLLKKFGEKTAVDIPQYAVEEGEILGLVGNNGAGKTTLFRLILDLIKADRGYAYIRGINVCKSEEWKTMTGAYIDDGFLIDYLTPEEYFYFVGKTYGLNKQAVDERLEPFRRFMSDEIVGQKKYIRNYSMGNKQKIGIIGAMIHHPALLILDEPFNFLDPTSQSLIKILLKNYHQQTGAAILISSHNLNHTIDICTRVALLEHGHIIKDLANHDNSAKAELEDYFEVKEEAAPAAAVEKAKADDEAKEEAKDVPEEAQNA